MKKIKVNITWDENFGAYSDHVPGAVIATHKTLEGVKEAFASALNFHLQGMRKDGDDIPLEFQGDYELEFEPDIQALLKHLDGKVTRSAIARVTGINERQLGHYVTGRVTPRAGNREKVVEGIRRLGKELLDVV